MRRWIRLPALKPLGLLATALLIAAAADWLLPADAAREPAGTATSAQAGSQTAQQAGAQPTEQKRAVPVIATAATAKDFPAQPADLPQGQPGRPADPDSRIDLRCD